MRPPRGRYRNYRNRTYTATAGQEAARRHIEEARQFEQEMGGTVTDVKKYFFSLPDADLNEVLSAYGCKYGASKEAYARQILPKWRSGSTKMSGDVAKRLFNFLPPLMPISTKFELAGNLWRHFGPASTHYFTVGPRADANGVIEQISTLLFSKIQNYDIPLNIKNRFEWLAAGDVIVKEQLLNYFRQMDRKIAIDSIHALLPILQAQMRDNASHTGSIRTNIEIQKHSVEIWIDPKLGSDFREGRPAQPSNITGTSGTTVFLIIAALAALIVVMYLLSHHR